MFAVGTLAVVMEYMYDNKNNNNNLFRLSLIGVIHVYIHASIRKVE